MDGLEADVMHLQRIKDKDDQMVKSKETEIVHLNIVNQALDKELEYVREALKNSQILNGIELTNEGLLDYDQIEDKNTKKIEFFKRCEVNLRKKRAELEGWITTFEENNIEKEEVIYEMDQVIRKMVKSKKIEKGSQVNEAELLWTGDTVLQAVKVKKRELNLGKLFGEGPWEESPDTIKGPYDGQSKQMSLGFDELEKIFELKKEDQRYYWNVPASIQWFLSNCIAEKQMVKVLSWVHLRKIIYQILGYAKDNRRCNRTGEEVSLQENLCLFFLKVSDKITSTL